MGTIEDIKDFWGSNKQTADILFNDRHLLLRKETDEYFTYLYADVKPFPRALPKAHSHYAELNYYIGYLKRLIKPP